jgi:NHL repeat
LNIAHNITCDADDWVYVADRKNHRVQVFDGNGRYEVQWNNLHRPSGLFMTSGAGMPGLPNILVRIVLIVPFIFVMTLVYFRVLSNTQHAALRLSLALGISAVISFVSFLDRFYVPCCSWKLSLARGL